MGGDLCLLPRAHPDKRFGHRHGSSALNSRMAEGVHSPRKNEHERWTIAVARREEVMTADQVDTLQIEREKLDLERRKLDIEIAKTKWTAIAAKRNDRLHRSTRRTSRPWICQPSDLKRAPESSECCNCLFLRRPIVREYLQKCLAALQNDQCVRQTTAGGGS
jgi:hypothetical protein